MRPAAALLRLFWLIVLCLCALPAQASSVVTTPQVRAELVAHAPEGIAPGKPFWLGLLIRHQDGWHTYWRNPGDSGLPTMLTWALPAGVKAGEIDWPAPLRLPVGSLLNYGYEGTVLLPVPVQVAPDFAGDKVDVQLRADWLVCKVECIPESGNFSLSLPTGTPLTAHAAQFEAAFAARPVELQDVKATAFAEGYALVLRVEGLPERVRDRQAEVYYETAGLIEHAEPVLQSWEAGVWEGRVLLSPQRSASPETIPAVLVFNDRQDIIRVAAPMSTPWSQVADVPPKPMPTFDLGRFDRPAPVAPENDLSLAVALGFAFVGGLLLNLMPCVFPVLSLKLLGFADHAHKRARLVAGGFAYTAGVLLSFVALAGLLLALRAAGEQLGWGFQLQEPGFVASLAVLFTLIGLNLAGVFELRAVLPASLGGWQLRHPIADAFFTGVIAVAIASPCTAPFMGAALGFAVTLPAAQALAVFASLGLGMAAPYLVASVVPAVARALPRPGPWLLRFKILMAFPMFATVVWLIWVLGMQTGIDGAVAMLALLVAVALVAWAWGSPAVAGRARWALGLPALLILAGVFAWALPAWKTAVPAAAAVEAGWEAWSPKRVAELRAQGRPVFVDFTAAWCVTCQYNKRTTLADDRVLQAFASKNVALLRADWTTRDDAISAELAALGRTGVPVYALYPADEFQPPRLLSELLSVKEVQEAVAEL